jgi:hypothetical protein
LSSGKSEKVNLGRAKLPSGSIYDCVEWIIHWP